MYIVYHLLLSSKQPACEVGKAMSGHVGSFMAQRGLEPGSSTKSNF